MFLKYTGSSDVRTMPKPDAGPIQTQEGVDPAPAPPSPDFVWNQGSVTEVPDEMGEQLLKNHPDEFEKVEGSDQVSETSDPNAVSSAGGGNDDDQAKN